MNMIAVFFLELRLRLKIVLNVLLKICVFSIKYPICFVKREKLSYTSLESLYEFNMDHDQAKSKTLDSNSTGSELGSEKILSFLLIVKEHFLEVNKWSKFFFVSTQGFLISFRGSRIILFDHIPFLFLLQRQYVLDSESVDHIHTNFSICVCIDL